MPFVTLWLDPYSECGMDLIEQVTAGFASVEAPESYRQRAVGFLRQWLTEPAFAAYRPQIE